MSQTRWIVPQAKEPVAAASREERAAPLAAGRRFRLGLLDNTKDNARLLLELIGERVRQEFEADVLIRRKGNATVGASAELLDELAREADCVITASAD